MWFLLAVRNTEKQLEEGSLHNSSNSFGLLPSTDSRFLTPFEATMEALSGLGATVDLAWFGEGFPELSEKLISPCGSLAPGPFSVDHSGHSVQELLCCQTSSAHSE